MKNSYDFSGWATKNNLRCSDGRTIRHNAFADDDGREVPLVWMHQHNSPENTLGRALLENREDGVYAYCSFNNTEKAKIAKQLVEHRDITSLSIHANNLTQRGGDVLHGTIREVSLVLAGANPGAFIDTLSLAHGDGTFEELEDEAIIFTGEELEHSDDYSEEEGEEEMNNELTVGEVYDSFSDEEKAVVEYLVAEAIGENVEPPFDNDTMSEILDNMSEEEQASVEYLVDVAVDIDDDMDEEDMDEEDMYDDDMDEEDMDEEDMDEEDVEHGAMGGINFMKYNAFENNEYDYNLELTHGDMEDIFANAQRSGSLKTAVEAYADVINHSVDDVDMLFPDYHALMEDPSLIKRDDEWVTKVWNNVKKTPFSRVKGYYADITADEARAKGFIKGKQKIEEVFPILKRTTDPQTVYKLQKMHRDDILDITDFDVVAWIKAEMRLMLNEELARAVLVGDGRLATDDSHIDPLHIRPVWTDDKLFTIKKTVEFADNATNYDKAETIVEAVLRSRKDYKGTGTPTAYCSSDTLTTMLLAKDNLGRRMYNSITDLANALRVKEIVEVPVFDNLPARTDKETNDQLELQMLIVNLADYSVGADKGGAVTMFDDFDIDYNKYSYLIETRCSGALTKPYSAIAIETKKSA